VANGGRADGSRTLLERAGSTAAAIGDVTPKHPAARFALQWGIAALVFGFLIWFVLRQWSKLPDFNWRFSPGWLALSAATVFLFYFLQCEYWRVILSALGEHIPAGPRRSLWAKSILARYVPTNALMVVGRVVMAERYGVPKRVCLASIAYELVLGFGTAVIVGAYFVIKLPSLQDQAARWAILVVVPAVLVVIHPRVFGPVANYALGKLGRERLPKTLPFGRVLQVALLYLLAWAVIGLGLFAFASALQSLDFSDLPYIASAYPVAFCVAVLTFIVPSGLGTRDATLATAMTAVLTGTVATAIAVAFRIFQTVVELLFVAAMVGLGRRGGDERTPAG
jgi:glycosyltransferase 2 family protein